MEEQFPVPRYTAASKIGNSVISLLWQLRCRCNPDNNKFSSLPNTTVVANFPNLCLWRPSVCSNLGDIDPEKLYRATVKDKWAQTCSVIFFLKQEKTHLQYVSLAVAFGRYAYAANKFTLNADSFCKSSKNIKRIR